MVVILVDQRESYIYNVIIILGKVSFIYMHIKRRNSSRSESQTNERMPPGSLYEAIDVYMHMDISFRKKSSSLKHGHYIIIIWVMNQAHACSKVRSKQYQWSMLSVLIEVFVVYDVAFIIFQ